MKCIAMVAQRRRRGSATRGQIARSACAFRSVVSDGRVAECRYTRIASYRDHLGVDMVGYARGARKDSPLFQLKCARQTSRQSDDRDDGALDWTCCSTTRSHQRVLDTSGTFQRQPSDFRQNANQFQFFTDDR